jgi:hypothetical protein
VADELIASKSSGWRSEIHLAQWRSSLNRYCGAIRDKSIDEIDIVAVLEVLKPLWTRTVEDIASAGGVSLNTIRTQVRGVLEKTGCRRQAEVVALLGGITVPQG